MNTSAELDFVCRNNACLAKQEQWQGKWQPQVWTPKGHSTNDDPVVHEDNEWGIETENPEEIGGEEEVIPTGTEGSDQPQMEFTGDYAEENIGQENEESATFETGPVVDQQEAYPADSYPPPSEDTQVFTEQYAEGYDSNNQVAPNGNLEHFHEGEMLEKQYQPENGFQTDEVTGNEFDAHFHPSEDAPQFQQVPANDNFQQTPASDHFQQAPATDSFQQAGSEGHFQDPQASDEFQQSEAGELFQQPQGGAPFQPAEGEQFQQPEAADQYQQGQQYQQQRTEGLQYQYDFPADTPQDSAPEVQTDDRGLEELMSELTYEQGLL